MPTTECGRPGAGAMGSTTALCQFEDVRKRTNSVSAIARRSRFQRRSLNVRVSEPVSASTAQRWPAAVECAVRRWACSTADVRYCLAGSRSVWSHRHRRVTQETGLDPSPSASGRRGGAARPMEQRSAQMTRKTLSANGSHLCKSSSASVKVSDRNTTTTMLE